MNSFLRKNDLHNCLNSLNTLLKLIRELLIDISGNQFCNLQHMHNVFYS